MKSLLVPLLLFAMNYSMACGASAETGDTVISVVEHRLKVLADSILKGSTDVIRTGALAEFNPVFWDLLNRREAFDYPFDSLKNVSKVLSSDGHIRILTWLLPSRTGDSYSYYGVVQELVKNENRVRTTGLTEVKPDPEQVNNAEFKPENWYGTIYYDMIECRSGKQIYYTLLGWKGNNRITTRKIIEIMTIDMYGNITFGKPILDTGDGLAWNRVVFEYNANAVMLLRYDEHKRMIVFDHLSPSSPGLKGNYEHYGPDFTYDGYRFKKGLWQLRKNLEMNNP